MVGCIVGVARPRQECVVACQREISAGGISAGDLLRGSASERESCARAAVGSLHRIRRVVPWVVRGREIA